MPCIFCLAVFALFAGAITTAVIDQMEARIASVATEPVQRGVDSESATSFETAVAVPGSPHRVVPVTVTVYKQHRRVRIQVRTHDVSRAEAEAVENLLAQVLELTIVDRSDAHDEAKVRQAFEEDLEAELTEQTPEQLARGTGMQNRSARPRG